MSHGGFLKLTNMKYKKLVKYKNSCLERFITSAGAPQGFNLSPSISEIMKIKTKFKNETLFKI